MIELYLLILAGLVVYCIVVFNRLIGARNSCTNARAGIDVNLTRRHQLIPNLVAVVRGYAAHEHCNAALRSVPADGLLTPRVGRPSATAREVCDLLGRVAHHSPGVATLSSWPNCISRSARQPGGRGAHTTWRKTHASRAARSPAPRTRHSWPGFLPLGNQ